MSELRCLEEIGFTCELDPPYTPRMVGRKPLGYPASNKYLEFMQMAPDARKEAILEILRSMIAA